MATPQEIQEALVVLSGARLRNAPARDEAILVAQTWGRVMTDIPGSTLLQAVDDLVLTAEFWPTVKEVRAHAYQVKAHNNTSAAANPFKSERTWMTPPAWTRKESDRLEKEIGYLLVKPREEWTQADIAAYEQAIGARIDSPEETEYWANLFEAAYRTPHMEVLTAEREG